MIPNQNPNEFSDISGILHRDVGIEFSACHLLDNDDYLMLTSLRKQKFLKTKQKTKVYKSNNKKHQKQVQILPKNMNQQPLKPKKNIAYCNNEASEKETQDSCYTAAKSLSIQSPKTPIQRRQRLNQNKFFLPSLKIVSNKNQLLQKNRFRSKSNSSIHSFRKKSVNQIEDFNRKSIASSILTSKNLVGQKIGKMRSQTIRNDFEQIKKNNENMIRNDYFQQDLPRSPKNHKQVIKQTCKNFRSVSQTKKNDLKVKRSKKNVISSDKNIFKSEKVRRK